MSDPMKQAWNDVADGFSTLGRMVKERYQGMTGDESSDAAPGGGVPDAGAALRARRSTGSWRRDGSSATARGRRGERRGEGASRTLPAASLNDALSATVDLIGEEVGGLFGRSKRTETTPEITEAAPPPTGAGDRSSP